MIDEEFDRWLKAVEQAYFTAYHERLADLHGEVPRRFDGRGLHPYSYTWGVIDTLLTIPIQEWLQECGFELAGVSAPTLRKEAAADALAAFTKEVKMADG